MPPFGLALGWYTAEDQQRQEETTAAATEIAEPELTIVPSQTEHIEREPRPLSEDADQRTTKDSELEQTPYTDDTRQPVSEHVTQVMEQTTIEDEYRKTDTEITEKEDVYIERLVHKEEYHVAASEMHKEEETESVSEDVSFVEKYEVTQEPSKETRQFDVVEKQTESSSAVLSMAAVCVVPEEEEVEETVESTQFPETKTAVRLVPKEEEAVEEAIKPEEAAPAPQADVCLVPAEDEIEEETIEISQGLVSEAGTCLVPEDEDIVEETVEISQAPLSEAGTCLISEEGISEETIEISQAPVSEAGTCLVLEDEDIMDKTVEISHIPLSEAGTCIVPTEEEVEEVVVQPQQLSAHETSILVQEETTAEISRAPLSEAGTCLVPEEEEIEEVVLQPQQSFVHETAVCLIPEVEIQEETIEVKEAPSAPEAAICVEPCEEPIKPEEAPPAPQADVCLVPAEDEIEEEIVEISKVQSTEAGTCVVPEEEEVKEETVEVSQAPVFEAGTCLVPEEEEVKEETIEVSQAPVSEAGTCLVPEEEEIEEVVQPQQMTILETSTCLVPEEEVQEETVEISQAPSSEAGTCLVPEEEEIEEEVVQPQQPSAHEAAISLVLEEEVMEKTIERTEAPSAPEAGVCVVPEEEELEMQDRKEEDDTDFAYTETAQTDVCVTSEELKEVHEAVEARAEAETSVVLVDDKTKGIPVVRPDITDHQTREDTDYDEEGDEDWEILEKEDLTEEEHVAAMNEALMQVSDSKDTYRETEDTQLHVVETQAYQQAEERYDSQFTDSYQYEQITEQEFQVTKFETEHLLDQGATEPKDISDEKQVEKSERISSALPVSEPSAVEMVETEDQKEKVDVFDRMVEEDKEVEDSDVKLTGSKPSETSLDMSEVVGILDDTDKTYENKIDEVIMMEAREEMEGEALEVCVARQSPDSDKETEELDARFQEPYVQVQPEMYHDVQYKVDELYEQIETEEKEICQEIPDETEQENVCIEDQVHVTAQATMETVEGVATEQEMADSPGSKISDISPVCEEQMEPVPATEFAQSIQQESYTVQGESQESYEQMSYAEYKTETVTTTFEEFRHETISESTSQLQEEKQLVVKPQEPEGESEPFRETISDAPTHTDDLLIAAMPDVPQRSPHVSSSDDDGEGEERKEDTDRVPSEQQVEQQQIFAQRQEPDTQEYDSDISSEKYELESKVVEVADAQVVQTAEQLQEKKSDDESEEDFVETSEQFNQEMAELDVSPVEESPPDVAELDQEIEEQDALTQALMFQYHVGVTKEQHMTHFEMAEEVEYAVPDFREGESDYESEEEGDVALETFDVTVDDKDEEDAQFVIAQEGTGQLVRVESTEKQHSEKYEEELAEKQREEQPEEFSQLETTQSLQQSESYQERHISKEEAIVSSRDLYGMDVQGAEGFTQECPEDRQDIDMSRSSESTEVQMASSGEGLLVEPYPQEYDIMAISGATEGDQFREPDYTDMFETHDEGETSDHDDLYEGYSDESEEELKPLKIPVEDSPTEQPTTDFLEDTMEQAERPDIEAGDSRQSPVYDRSPEEEVYRSPTDEQLDDRPFDSPLQEELVEEDKHLMPSPEPQKEVKGQAEQAAVSGILAELQDIEQFAGQEQSDEELEDDLGQYEEEEEQEQLTKSEQQLAEAIIVTDQFVDRKESFTTEERDVSVPIQTVDQQEDVTTEQRDESVPVESTEQEEEEDELTTNVYVDRTERFIEEPIETITPGGDSTANGFISGTTDMDSSGTGAAEPVIEEGHLSAQSSLSEHDAQYPEYMDEHHLSLHPPLYPSSSTEVQDRSRTPSDIEIEEPAQNGMTAAAGATGSYTSEITSGSQSYLSESTMSRMSESDYTSHSETWAASECTMTGSEFEHEGRITVDTSELIHTEEKIEDSYQESDEAKPQMDTLDRPMSPSEYTLITSHDQDRMMQILDLQAQKPAEEQSEEEEEEEEEDEMDRDSLLSEESDEVMSDDEQGSERPPSPTEYTLIASQDQEALTQVLGLQAESLPLEALHVDTQEPLSTAVTARDKDETEELRIQTELELQSSGSSEQAVIQLLDSVDNTVSNISSDREFEKDSDLQKDFEAPLEPSAPYMPPSPGSENLYQEMFTKGDFSEAHMMGGHAPGFEDYYAVGMVPQAAGFTGEGDSIDREDMGSGDEIQTHRVVMRKEVHKKTVIRPDGQEETIIKEDSQIHQDSEPPEELRDSMQAIINQFMDNNPQVPEITGEGMPEIDEGTEV